jgi:hypothetical protein
MRTFFVIVFTILPAFTQAQLKHYFSYNTSLHVDFFNHEKDKVDIGLAIHLPALSYKVQKKKVGVEVYYSVTGILYHNSQYPDIKPGQIPQIILTTLGITAHYRLLDSRRVKINSMLGLVQNWYDSETMLGWLGGNFLEPVMRNEDETKTGFVMGGNINVPFYKGIYANANVRYAIFPTADYNKQNLITEMGIGYMFQRKLKK